MEKFHKACGVVDDLSLAVEKSEVLRGFSHLLSYMKDDNPTIGLILCSEKNESIARYSVLNNSKQLFASKYMLYLPTEEELERELERERRVLIEERQQTEDKGNQDGD